MDQTAFIKTLNSIFCETNQNDKKYSEVWLSEADFGGVYNSGKFVLNVKAEHRIPACDDEIFAVIRLLQEKAPKALESIWRVVVYNSDDDIHCVDDLPVYTQSDACR